MKVSFIGCGNMAGAMIGGLLRSGRAAAEDICASAPSDEARARARNSFGIRTFEDNAECVKGADVVILAVKPYVFRGVAGELRGAVQPGQLLVSIAAGITLDQMEEMFGSSAKLVRVMPNTPALVGEGISGWCANEQVTDTDRVILDEILTSFGEAEEVPESLMGVVTSVSGSSPAYVFMFIEAMADAAVLDGMPRKKAYHFAAQTVLGAAKMVLETGKHPGELKDMVTSPAGTTIEGVAALERGGFRGTVIDAVHACTLKATDR